MLHAGLGDYQSGRVLLIAHWPCCVQGRARVRRVPASGVAWVDYMRLHAITRPLHA